MQRNERYGSLIFWMLCVLCLMLCVWRSRTASSRIEHGAPNVKDFIELRIGEPRHYPEKKDSVKLKKTHRSKRKKTDVKEKTAGQQVSQQREWLDSI